MNEQKLQEMQQFLLFSGNFLINITKIQQFYQFPWILKAAKPEKLSCVIGNEMIGNHNHFTYHLK